MPFVNALSPIDTDFAGTTKSLPSAASPAPIPIPFPNIGIDAPSVSPATRANFLLSSGLSKSGAANAVAGKPVSSPVDAAVVRGLSKSSGLPSTSGDEAGVAGGVVSGAGGFPTTLNVKLQPTQPKLQIPR